MEIIHVFRKHAGARFHLLQELIVCLSKQLRPNVWVFKTREGIFGWREWRPHRDNLDKCP